MNSNVKKHVDWQVYVGVSVPVGLQAWHCPKNYLSCVGWGIKPYSLTVRTEMELPIFQYIYTVKIQCFILVLAWPGCLGNWP